MPDPEDAIPDRDDLRELLADVGDMWMPFGKYGPKHFPPRGVPIRDLPSEYLHWFKTKGGKRYLREIKKGGRIKDEFKRLLLNWVGKLLQGAITSWRDSGFGQHSDVGRGVFSPFGRALGFYAERCTRLQGHELRG